MKPILIIKAGSTFPNIASKYGDFDDWVISGTNASRKHFRVVSIFQNEPLPEIDLFSGVVITGSHSMVSDDESWINDAINWLKKASKEKIPIFGICFGHQLICHALGGIVDYHPKGLEIGCVEVQKHDSAQDFLFKDLPKRFNVYVTHKQSVVTLPPGANILASNAFERHQAVVINNHIWGVQFHPEFNQEIMIEYIEEHREYLQDRNLDIDSLIESTKPLLNGNHLLVKFYEYISRVENWKRD